MEILYYGFIVGAAILLIVVGLFAFPSPERRWKQRLAAGESPEEVAKACLDEMPMQDWSVINENVNRLISSGYYATAIALGHAAKARDFSGSTSDEFLVDINVAEALYNVG